MKKILLVLLIVMIMLSSLFILAACSSNPIVPRPAWGSFEQLTYDIVEDNNVIGSLTTTIERLEEGSYTIEKIRSQPFTISSKSVMGIKFSQIAIDKEGKTIMESVSILNGFKALGSYKMMDYKDKKYTANGYLDGKNYKSWLNGVEQKKMKVGNSFVDNELLYTSLRIYNELDSSYSSTMTVADPLGGTSEKFTASTTGTTQNYKVSFINADSIADEGTVSCAVVTFRKSNAPIGNAIEVWYAKSEFKLYGKADTAGNYSFHIPVKIIENNLTYNLTNATAIAS